MTIRDLGYKAYDGPLLSSRKRYGVMISRSLSLAWASGLVKATLIVGGLPLLICAVIMYLKFKAQQIMSIQGAPMQLEDAGNWVYYCVYWCQLWFSFAMGLLVAAPAVASDVETGAFQFYFARPINRAHYAAAKLGSAGLLVLLVCAVPGLLLALMRLGLAQSGEDAMRQLPLLGKTILFASIMGLVLSLPPLALGALTRRSGHAQGGWATLFFLPWVLGEGMAAATDFSYLALASIPTCLRLVGQAIYGISPSYPLPWYLPAGVLLALIALSATVLLRRLARVEVFM